MSGDQTVRQYKHRADIQRLTADAFDGRVPITIQALTFSRPDEFYVQATLTDFELGTGNVIVTGLDLAGVTQTVTLAFTGNQRRMNNQQRFLSLFSLTSSGLTNEAPPAGNVTVSAVSRTGQPVEEFTTIQVNIPVRFSGLRRDERVAAAGGAESGVGKCYLPTTPEIKRRDKIVWRGTTYNVRALNKQMDRHGLRSFFTALVAAEDQL